MDPFASVVFSLGSFTVLPFWLLMMLAPRWRLTERLVSSPPFVVAGPVLLYALLLLPVLPAVIPAVARPELGVITALLGSSRGAAIAWIHFLALDLFAGRWIFMDARARGLRSVWVSPLLLLTLLLAPLGLGAYLLARTALERANTAEQRATSATSGTSGTSGTMRGFARGVWDGHRPLALVTLASTALLVATVILGRVDARQVMGAPVWMKPMKFAASVGLATSVLAWIIGQMRGLRTRRVHVAGTVIGVVATFELAVITLQAARGVPSHFNHATRLDAFLFASMGAAISVLWFAELVIAVYAARHRFATPMRTWGIRLGLVGTLVGGGIGFVMPRPTAAQLVTLRAGQPTPLVGAHAVGVPDGGPGLPVTRWSTTGGDLRAPHFFGLHALQGLPLLAWAWERRRRAATARPAIALGVGWIGLTLVALWQALRGQPLLAPDALTLAAALAVIMAAALMAVSARSRLDPARVAAGASSFAPEPAKV
jgi:hypothetical protein